MHPPTWAQQQTWAQQRAMRGASDPLNVPLAVEVTAGADLAGVLGAVRAIVERHEALRSRYHAGPDGRLGRVAVAGSGELAVDVCEVESAEYLQRHGHELVFGLQRRPLDPEGLPVRIVVFAVAGSPRLIVMSISHLSVDGWGSGVVNDELRQLVAGAAGAGGQRVLPPVQWRPRDQVAFERSDRGRRRADRALAYWRDQLVRFPEAMLPAAGPAEAPRFADTYFVSPAVAAAAFVLARRCGVTTAAVALAAYALVLAHRTGRPAAYLTLLTPNRIESRAQTAVGNLYQHAPITVEVAGGTFEDLAGRALVATMKGYRYGQVDPVRLRELKAELAAQRGGEPDLRCLANLHMGAQAASGADRDQAVEVHEGLPETPERIAELVPDSELTARGGADQLPVGLFLSVWKVAKAAEMSLWGDTTLLPSAGQRQLLTDLERVMVAAVGQQGVGTDELAGLTLAG